VAMCTGVVFITLRTNCERQTAGRSGSNFMMAIVCQSVSHGGYRNVILLYVMTTSLYIVSSSYDTILLYLLKDRIRFRYKYLTRECRARGGKESSNFPVTCVIYIYICICNTMFKLYFAALSNPHRNINEIFRANKLVASASNIFGCWY